MQYYACSCLIALLILLSACVHTPDKTVEEPSSYRRSDWAVDEGFAIDVDAEGFHLPTALAFVPNPGPEPKSPLYFVTELWGKVKIVTNDRTVYTFAEDFFQRFVHEERLPIGGAQSGLAGICLEPERGYVFVTFAYVDSVGRLRNNIIRFQSTPQTFSLKPTSHLAFTEVFLPYETGVSHQIGPCQTKDGLLYVGVGEGWQPYLSQDIYAMHGKIIRMTLDGKALPDNPFYQDSNVSKAANYVWSYGLRNPFSLAFAEDRLFVFDNGHNVDRFLEVRKGENYLWDGHDWSISTNADFVLAPSLGPVQMDYLPQDASVFPDGYTRTLYVALAGAVVLGKKPGILMLKYGFEENKLLSAPKLFARYQGKAYQIVAALAFGPDALYFAPLLPGKDGTSPVLKITYSPEQEIPSTFAQAENPATLMLQRGCLGCHTLNGDWGRGEIAAPPLDNTGALVDRIKKRISTEEYVNRLKTFDKSENNPLYRKARNEILDAEGLEKIRSWIAYKIQYPRLDEPYSRMPQLNIPESEARVIADYLVQTDQISRLRIKVRESIPESLLPAIPRRKHLFYYLVVGFSAGVLFTTCCWLTLRHTKGRKRKKQAAVSRPW